jgi:crossover junction endodeoxyribonuclease RuvC
MRLIGIDPGLRTTGWGVIEADGNRLRHIANGRVKSEAGASMAERLAALYDGLVAAIETWKPFEAAVEETFVNANPASALKLGQARGIALLAPARCGLPVAEYAANAVKKAIVGAGHADKNQIQTMVARLMPGVEFAGPDAADALAIAICHAHHAASRNAWAKGTVMAGAK